MKNAISQRKLFAIISRISKHVVKSSGAVVIVQAMRFQQQ